MIISQNEEKVARKITPERKLGPQVPLNTSQTREPQTVSLPWHPDKVSQSPTLVITFALNRIPVYLSSSAFAFVAVNQPISEPI